MIKIIKIIEISDTDKSLKNGPVIKVNGSKIIKMRVFYEK